MSGVRVRPLVPEEAYLVGALHKQALLVTAWWSWAPGCPLPAPVLDAAAAQLLPSRRVCIPTADP